MSQLPPECPHEPAPEFGWDTLLPELTRLHRPRILVVEDDPDLRSLVERAADSLDVRPTIDWAGSVGEAQARLERMLYDLVLADYVLEGEAPGLELRHHCLERQPQTGFAMMSVHPLPDFLHSVGGAGSPFLQKPFSVSECRRFLRRMLAGVR